jgi:hypothetical protein
LLLAPAHSWSLATEAFCLCSSQSNYQAIIILINKEIAFLGENSQVHSNPNSKTVLIFKKKIGQLTSLEIVLTWL